MIPNATYTQLYDEYWGPDTDMDEVFESWPEDIQNAWLIVDDLRERKGFEEWAGQSLDDIFEAVLFRVRGSVFPEQWHTRQ